MFISFPSLFIKCNLTLDLARCRLGEGWIRVYLISRGRVADVATALGWLTRSHVLVAVAFLYQFVDQRQERAIDSGGNANWQRVSRVAVTSRYRLIHDMPEITIASTCVDTGIYPVVRVASNKHCERNRRVGVSIPIGRFLQRPSTPMEILKVLEFPNGQWESPGRLPVQISVLGIHHAGSVHHMATELTYSSLGQNCIVTLTDLVRHMFPWSAAEG